MIKDRTGSLDAVEFDLSAFPKYHFVMFGIIVSQIFISMCCNNLSLDSIPNGEVIVDRSFKCKLDCLLHIFALIFVIFSTRVLQILNTLILSSYSYIYLDNSLNTDLYKMELIFFHIIYRLVIFQFIEIYTFIYSTTTPKPNEMTANVLQVNWSEAKLVML